MTTQDTYHQILQQAEQLALATLTADGKPSVRMVNFLFDPSSNTVYVCTDRHAQKVQELATHPTVAFTTTPTAVGTVRVKTATATLVNDRKPALLAAMDKKYASFKMFDQAARDNMFAYALTYPEADVFFRGNTTLTF
ncbi:pyridoxamine 5'-phosphate oxidase family protein [Lacticaseibacillus parakribbianus]|uniref:pyridoxamine 5'-phosphate oxidase family protein n=1 Tax=Lacticaseibacillus parakribbianus TaxID=2970927 RepID=UPI0021CAED1A|nr:pyridoxamine 5'-phosphate oxidase family protein [Lacticaseibacillus parakribbianus]